MSTVTTFDMNARVKLDVPAWIADIMRVALEQLDVEDEDTLIHDGRRWALGQVAAGVADSGAYEQTTLPE